MDPIGVVGFTFGVVSIIDLCTSHGKKLMAKYETYKTADTAFADSLLRTLNHWHIIEAELKVIRGLSHRLDEKIQVHLAHLFRRLHMKLQEAVEALDSVLGDKIVEPKSTRLGQVLKKRGPINKLKLASNMKNTIDNILIDLDYWHSMLQPYWFLLGLIQDPVVDQELSARMHQDEGNGQIYKLKKLRDTIHEKRTTDQSSLSMFIAENGLVGSRFPIDYTDGEIGEDSKTGAHLYIEPFKAHSGLPPGIALKNVRDLGRTLSAVDPKLFFILECKGIIKIIGPSQRVDVFELVFHIPEHLKHPMSFRQALLESTRCDLADCFRFAKQLAKAVLFVHTTNLVHKNVRPETILLFQESTLSNKVIGVPFLVGFQSLRFVDGVTFMSGDSEWQKNLYRHPTRQGTLPEESYQMQHDIYSLGVCLLELGLWESFVFPHRYENGKVTYRPNPSFNISRYLALEQPKRASGIKQELKTIAGTKLPILMGPRYTKIVLMCLGCLDRENNEFGHISEFLDDDGILVGVRYIEKVCKR